MIGHRAALALALGLALAAPAGDQAARGCARGAGADPAGAPPAPAPPAPADPLDPLRALEAARRSSTDFARVPPSSAVLGPDPIALQRIPSSPYLVSALRGADALALLDAASLAPRGPLIPAPASPTGLAVTPSGEVLAAGEASPEIRRYTLRGAELVPAGALALEGVTGVRDLAAGPEGLVYALDERAGTLLTLQLPPARGTSPALIPKAAHHATPLCAGPFQIRRAPRHLLVNCLLDHTLVVRRVDGAGRPLPDGEARIRHDGPIWSFSAIPVGEHDLLVAAAGVEDHPLDRTGGFFGHIDSFVFLYSIPGAGPAGEARRLAAVNVSELGVITPKALALEVDPAAGLRLRVTGYGGPARAELRWPRGSSGSGTEPLGDPERTSAPFPPGVAATLPLGGGAYAHADPLLDAFLLERDGAVSRVPAPASPALTSRPVASRLGEALFFTALMAPWNSGEGPLSRFTCETCHFEGTVDGRTHHTGRGDVRATTKPLLGLFNNRPHFSRALDPDLATMVNNEFSVAGAKSGRDPWFSLTAAEVPWLRDLDVGEGPFSPESLREALMTFLMEFTHRPNPAAQGREHFGAIERRGAEVFRDRCERCHAARLASDEPGSQVPFERWESLIFTPEGPIVWGRDGYEKTGVEPYVHERGARPPSLRRLFKKRPYFTNGATKNLGAVLERARFGEGGAFFHDGGPAGAEPLRPDEIEALLAFLDLL